MEMSNINDEQAVLNAKEVSLDVATDANLTSPEEDEEERDESRRNILYRINEAPPWHLCIIQGLQHFFLTVDGSLAIQYIIVPLLCLQEDDPSKALVISSVFFVSGIVTLMQTCLGSRLPIVQGVSSAYIVTTVTILSTTFDSCQTYDFTNITSAEKDYIWMTRMRAIQGAIIVSSLIQVLIALTGLVGFIASWITPLTIVPALTLLGLSLFRIVANKAATHWGISMMTAFFFTFFTQYLSAIPLSRWKVNIFFIKFQHIVKFFPILITILISWSICAVLTAFEVFPEDSKARTDTKISIIQNSPWFYVPYPFQWGLPTVTASGVIGMIAGTLASIVDSIGDYYACSRLAESPPPPEHAINRGIFIEGIGSIFTGIIGTANSTSSYASNIAALRITKVASRRVIQVAAILMIFCGVFTKLASIITSVPEPIVGGIFIFICGSCAAMGLSFLKTIDLNSSRNIFILGVSLFLGLAIPEWLNRNPGSIQTGFPVADQILFIILSINMFVGGLIGSVLDHTIPGTEEERGLTNWNQMNRTSEGGSAERDHQSPVYDLPFGMEFFRRHKILSFIPISPTFKGRKG